MCLAIPGQIVELAETGELAIADVIGVKRTINVALLETEGLRLGDWVLIHVGFAMAKLDEEEAHRTLHVLQEMGQVWLDEVEALGPVQDEGG
jgi:hydrogenase expression/formation protein HypC